MAVDAIDTTELDRIGLLIADAAQRLDCLYRTLPKHVQQILDGMPALESLTEQAGQALCSLADTLDQAEAA